MSSKLYIFIVLFISVPSKGLKISPSSCLHQISPAGFRKNKVYLQFLPESLAH